MTEQTPAPGANELLFAPGQGPLHFPYVNVPGWVTYSGLDAPALGLYAFLRTFVNETTGEWTACLRTREIASRFGIGNQAVSKTRKGKAGGMVQRLAALGALAVHPQHRKTHDCSECGTPREEPCPGECGNRRGRERSAPLYEMAAAPPAGFCFPGPLHRGEYKQPGKIPARIKFEAEVAPDDPRRRQVYPFYPALSWVALHPELRPLDVGVYVFLCAHLAVNEGRMYCTVLRSRLERRFGIGESTVSESTARLEAVGAIAKAGVVTAESGRRHGLGGAATYIVQAEPPQGMGHPHPLHVGEWRDGRLVAERLRAHRGGTAPRPAPGRGDGPGSGAGQGGGTQPSGGYPQAGSESYPQAPDGGGSPGGQDASREGCPQGPDLGDTPPDLGNVDNPGGRVPAQRGLGPVPEGVGSSPRGISNYLLSNYLLRSPGGSGPSEGAQPQGEDGPVSEAEHERHRAAQDLARAALERMPAKALPLRSERDRVRLVESIADRLREGYSPEQMAEALTVALGAARSAWVLTVRAAEPGRWLPQGSTRPAGSRDRALGAWCGECESDGYRYLVAEDESMVRRCPDCHPLARGGF